MHAKDSVPLVQLDRNHALAVFSRELGLTQAQILAGVSRYNGDYSAYGNEIYESAATRIAHWWNYEEQNWFARRINLCLSKLLLMPLPLFIDIGFSIPYLNADRRFAGRSDISALLVDKYSNVRDFYRAFTMLCPSGRETSDKVLVADIDDDVGRARVCRAVNQMSAVTAAHSVLIAGMELIEHLEDEEHFWRLVSDIGANARQRPFVYVTLPIGPKIPSHNLVFSSEREGLNYLRGRMTLKEHVLLKPAEGEASPYLTGCVCAFGIRKSHMPARLA